MSKNLTRKGLALTTVVAFGLTGFAAAPANAANAQNGLSLKPFVGKTYSVPLGTTFTLSSFGVAYDDNDQDLKFEVSNASGANVCWYDGDDYSDTADDIVEDYACSTDTSIEIAVYDSWANWDGDSNLDNWAYDYDSADGFQLNLWIDDASANTSVKVQSYIDSEPEGTSGYDEFDATEDTANASQTVTWAKTTATVSLDQPLLNDSSLTGTLTLSPAANLEQLDYDGYDSMSYLETYEGSSYSNNGYTYYDSDAKALLFDINEGGNVQAGTNYKVDSYLWVYDAEGSDGDWYDYQDVKSSTDKKAVIADKVDDISDPEAADSQDIYTDIDGDPSDGDDSYVYVRSGVKTLTLTAQAWKSYDDTKSPAGQPARVYVSDNSLESGSSVTVGGKTLKAGGDDIHIDTTTNAKGEIVIPITGSAKDGDVIDIWVESQGETSDDTYVYWEDAYADNLVNSTPYSSSDEANYVAVKNGANASLDFAVYDQFGKLYTSSNKMRLVTDLSDAGFSNNNDYVYSNVSGGKATVSFKDDSDEETDYYVNTWLEVYHDGAWDSSADEDSTSDVDSYIYTNDALLTPSGFENLEIQDGGNGWAGYTEDELVDDEIEFSLSPDDFGTADTRTGADSVDLDYDYAVWIEGNVVDKDISPVAGQKVTVTSAGAQFSSYEDDVFTIGSTSEQTDLDGYFGFYVWSHKAGDVKVNITAGGATHTVTLTFAGTAYADAVADDDAHLKVVVSPANAAAGSASNVAVTVVDGYGNALDCDGVNPDVDLEAIGAGYLSSETVTLTDSCKANVKLITGVADKGLTTINATISADDLDATADALVGVSAATKGGNNAVSATVKNAKGLTVQLFVAGKLVKSVVATSNNFTFSKAIKKTGTFKTKVLVNGIKVAAGKRTVF